VAQLALQRTPLDGWITEQQRTMSRHYRAVGVSSDVTASIAGGRNVTGRRARIKRRRRFGLMRWRLPREYVTFALHDDMRDRVVILHGTDDALLRAIAATIGL
jgi:hypothetical protein